MATFTFSSTDDLEKLLEAQDNLLPLIRKRIADLQEESERPSQIPTREWQASRHYYSPESIAEKLNLSRDRIVAACNAKELRFKWVPGKGGPGRRIDIDEAEAWYARSFPNSR